MNHRPYRVVWQIALLLLLVSQQLFAQSQSERLSADSTQNPAQLFPHRNAIYLTAYGDDAVELFSRSGAIHKFFARPSFPTGACFDHKGNLYVSSDDPADYAILKYGIDGTQTVFATEGLDAPHALAVDAADNLYVANEMGDSIIRFSPDGAGSIFADSDDGLVHPVDLAFDRAGNLYVTSSFGGTSHHGSIIRFTPDGSSSVFAEAGFSTPFGLAFDRTGNLYVSNFGSSTIQKLSPSGRDLGTFASTGVNKPHGIMFDSAGNLYVANNGNETIEIFSPAGADLGVFAQTASGPHFFAVFQAR